MVNAIGTVNQNPHTMTLEGIDELVETGNLLPGIRAPLNMNLTYNRAYYNEPIPVGEGQIHRVTKEGIPTANQDPTAPPSQTYGATGLDSGLVPITPGYEQFDIVMNPYRETTDFKMSNSKVSNLNKIVSRIRNLSNKMARTLNIAYRRPLSMASQFGHTYATTVGAANAVTATVHNLVGWNTSWVGGVPTAVSGSNPVRGSLYNGGNRYRIEVTSITVGARNDADDTTAGTLTFTVLTGQSAPYTNGPLPGIAVNDTIVADHASVVHRPAGKTNAGALVSGDTITLDMLINTSASMMANGVDPDMETGKILGFGDAFAWAALMKDTNFRTIYRDRYASEEFVGGAEIDLLNFKLIFGHDIAATTRSDGLKVRRIIFTGHEAAARGVFEQSDPRGVDFMDSEDAYLDVGPQFDVVFDPITQIKTIIRKPIDREGDVISITENAVLGMSAVPDTLATFAENSLAAFKRLAACEFIA
jgi:hypothetical protein